ncbi:XdhC family protein [Pseudogemmobacter sonorensis]|uniref:XdhC family protein n=1 Tax=Pseudogemmobacter sonorensis TaxID=2989681 RepID=UPI003697F6B2
MEPRSACVTFADFPIAPGIEDPRDTALAILTGTEGPAYRPVGAAMWIRDGRVVAGSLSSGCVERDIALHAMECLAEGRGRSVRYGAGSPYFDIRLPCGGALDVTILPAPEPGILDALDRARASRSEALLSVSDLGLRVGMEGGGGLGLKVVPDITFQIFGKGPEAATFAELAASAGYATTLHSPDDETLGAIQADRVTRHRLIRPGDPGDPAFDRYTAVALFFHDHEWEPAILARAAASDAFYIGAQGSRRTRARRDAALAELQVSAERIAAMKGPMGLLPRARDARTLAISVLAEVVAEADRLHLNRR